MLPEDPKPIDALAAPSPAPLEAAPARVEVPAGIPKELLTGRARRLANLRPPWSKGHQPIRGAGRPKGSEGIFARLDHARQRAEKRHRKKFDDLLFDLAYQSSPKFPAIAVALARKFYPDRTFNESDRAPQQIFIVNHIPPVDPSVTAPAPIMTAPAELSHG